MPYPRVSVKEGTFAPTVGAPTDYQLAELIQKRTEPSESGTPTHRSIRIIGMSCRVKRIGDGNGTVSFGTTTGGVASLMSTGEVASGVAGRKTTATGSDLAGNGVSRAPAAAYEFLTARYTKGTDSQTPIISYKLLYIEEDIYDRLMVL